MDAIIQTIVVACTISCYLSRVCVQSIYLSFVISCTHRNLSYNRFSGPIPDSAISNLAKLAYLYGSLATPLVLAHF